MEFLTKIKKFLTKWKLVDTSKNRICPKDSKVFILTDYQSNLCDKIYKDKGTIEYTFYPTGIGWGVKVKSWKTNEYFDITDTSVW